MQIVGEIDDWKRMVKKCVREGTLTRGAPVPDDPVTEGWAMLVIALVVIAVGGVRV